MNYGNPKGCKRKFDPSSLQKYVTNFFSQKVFIFKVALKKTTANLATLTNVRRLNKK